MNNKDAVLNRVGVSLTTKQWSTGGESKRLPLGADLLDQRLGGGMPRGALHEIFAEKSDNVASTSAFAMMLALCLTEINWPILWIMEEKVPRYSGQLYPPGMIALGANPDAMVVVETRDVKDALRASADAINSAAVAAVILSVRGNAPAIDLTATRRLALAASRAGVLALLLRFDATAVASAAYSRWQVASAPSRPLAANAPGFPAFDITLTRHRGGIPHLQHAWNGTMKNEASETRRYMAAYLPLLSAERLARHIGKAPEQPYALIEKQKGALLLAACNAGALSLGLVPGLPLANARARVPELATFPHDPDKDNALLNWLVAACERYTPLCTSRLPATILLDITGATHFYNDEQAIATDLKSRLQKQGLSSRIALGATPDSACALARFDRNEIYTLPVEALELESKMLTALRRAGLSTIGHLAVRPRTPLATRFGRACTLKLARLLEEEDPHITPLRSPSAITVERRFAEPVAHSEMALAILAELTIEAAIVLTERGQGGRRFEARLFRSDGHVASLAIDTGLPTRNAKLLQRLFRERIDSLSDPFDPGFGYDMIKLDVLCTELLLPAQIEIDGPPNYEGNWRALLDQLSIRLGSERVRFFYSRESHIPERAFFTKAATAQIPAQAWAAPDSEDPPMRPLTLFDPPQPVEVTAGFPDGEPRSFRWHRQIYRVILVEGPERIAPEWWRYVRGYESGNGSRSRDYYRVEDGIGGRFWLFRHGSDYEAERPKWYLHGAFA